MSKEIENEFTLTRPAKEELLNVLAYPDEVMIGMEAREKTLTIAETRSLAAALTAAADLAEKIDWDPDKPELVYAETTHA